MLVSVYIRKEDEELWRALEGKTQAIHDMLHNKQPSENISVPRVKAEPIRPLVEVIEEEPEEDFYANLILDLTGNSGVWDESTGEGVDADPDMIKELKRRKQTR